MKRISIGLVAMLAGCVAQPPHQMTTTFSDADFQPWAGSGPAALTGQAFLKTVGGDVKTCAGNEVTLIPATAYSRELIGVASTGGKSANVSPSVLQYFRTTTCDAQGNFTFAAIPAQTWIVEAKVTWGIPTGSVLFPIDTQGGILRKDAALHPGNNQIILSSQ